MRVDRLERFLQPLVRLAIELADGAAQLGDGVLDVGLLGVEAGRLDAELLQLLVGAEIDAAEPLAIGLEARQLALDVGERRQVGAGLDLGQRQAAFRRDAERFADLPRHVLAARARAFEPRFGAGAAFAPFGDGALRGAQRLHAGFQRRVGFGQRVGGDLPLALGVGQRAHQLVALFVDHRRHVGETFELASAPR